MHGHDAGDALVVERAAGVRAVVINNGVGLRSLLTHPVQLAVALGVKRCFQGHEAVAAHGVDGGAQHLVSAELEKAAHIRRRKRLGVERQAFELHGVCASRGGSPCEQTAVAPQLDAIDKPAGLGVGAGQAFGATAGRFGPVDRAEGGP